MDHLLSYPLDSSENLQQLINAVGETKVEMLEKSRLAILTAGDARFSL